MLGSGRSRRSAISSQQAQVVRFADQRTEFNVHSRDAWPKATNIWAEIGGEQFPLVLSKRRLFAKTPAIDAAMIAALLTLHSAETFTIKFDGKTGYSFPANGLPLAFNAVIALCT